MLSITCSYSTVLSIFCSLATFVFVEQDLKQVHTYVMWYINDSEVNAVQDVVLYAYSMHKQKHLGRKKVRGQEEPQSKSPDINNAKPRIL